jgi:CRP/FNR family transcriptional regulator, cyclic AMP receptor protein
MQLKELFQRIDFFSGLDDKILRKLADAAVTRQYGPDEMVIRQGEMGLGLYIIVRGKVKVEREQPGSAPIKVAELGPEQFFAEMSIVDNKPRSATVTTMEDTECLLLTRDSFVSLMQKYPEIPIRVAKLLAERLRVADEKLAAMHAAEAETGKAAGPAARAGGASAKGAGPSGNGDGPGAAAEGGKQRVQQSLLDVFQNLYTLKAFTRFSVAVLGCPVEGSAPNLIHQIRVGDVKALIFPSDEPVTMGISATRPGSFTLTVFLPDASLPYRFGPVPIHPADDAALVVEKGEVSLHVRRISCDNN